MITNDMIDIQSGATQLWTLMWPAEKLTSVVDADCQCTFQSPRKSSISLSSFEERIPPVTPGVNPTPPIQTAADGRLDSPHYAEPLPTIVYMGYV
jgi:hypothetical protein